MFPYPSFAMLLFSLCQLICQHPSPGAPDGMVLIPGGTFYIGSDNHQPAASPRHPVTLNAFYMDQHEVTNRQYHDFCMATGYKFPEFWGMEIYKSSLEFPDHPVVGVSHFEAGEFAEWAGKRLPTEAEWEVAARGGLNDISYYFGEKADHALARYNDPEAIKGPVKVGSYQPNAYGLYDMSGNVWEWVSDWYDEDYYRESPECNPPGPERGSFKAFRGGGWHSGPGCIAVHRRNALPEFWVDMAGGFRCVMDLEMPRQEQTFSGAEDQGSSLVNDQCTEAEDHMADVIVVKPWAHSPAITKN